VPCERG